MRAMAVGLAAAMAVLGGAAEAGACSVAGPIPSDEERFADARAAVVVRVTSRRSLDGGTDLRYGAKVERLAKPGAGGRWLRLRSTPSSACGVDLRRGQRVGLLLNDRLGRRTWRISIFEDLPPARLLALARRT